MALTTVTTEQAKRRQLVITKRRATALLGAVSVGFVAVTLLGHGATWAAYVQATAEASMVGGLADWFAVTALFRRPLGLPIPHTAIVVERKEQFGQTLGHFIQESFLTSEAIIERVRAADVSRRVAVWLTQPEHADQVASTVADAFVAIVDQLRDDEVHRAVEGLVRDRLEDVALAPIAGRLLEFLIKDGRHHEFVDAAISALDGYLDEHRDELHDRFGTKSPWWLPGAVEDRIFDRVVDGARNMLQDMLANPENELRVHLDERLAQLAVDLRYSPDMRARGEQLKHELLSQPQLGEWIESGWQRLKAELHIQAPDPDSELRRRLAGISASAGRRLRDDPAVTARADEVVETAATFIVEHFRGEIAGVVSGTIARWNAVETADRLELLLGPDLQYIRINGTVVGAMAGLALHTVAQLLS